MRQPDYSLADPQQWNTVDTYFTQKLAQDDKILTDALASNADSGLPIHDVSALQGQMIAILVQIAGAKRVLEIGTLGGYSTIRIARALPSDGIVVTIEANEHHAAVAEANFSKSDQHDKIDLRVGKALDVLPLLNGSFDLIFIDADKPNNPNYIQWALKLSRPGTVIIGDNVVRGGAVINPSSADPNVQGIRSFIDIIAAEPRLTATAIQTVGEKGWDGFVLARVSS